MAKKSEKHVGLENLAGMTKGRSDPLVFIPTGHHELDYAIAKGELNKHSEHYGDTNCGGLPLGKVVAVFGGEGSGKSSLAYRVCGYAQRMGLKPVWFDAEQSFSDTLAEINGVDLDELYRCELVDENDIENTWSAEKVFDMMIKACCGGANVIVLDSIANLIPQYELDHSIEQETMALMARVLTKAMKKLVNAAAKHNVLVILINQLRVDPGKQFGDPEGMPGGKALKHNSSIILKIKYREAKDAEIRHDPSDKNSRVIGRSTIVSIGKNRFAPPHREAIHIPVYYEHYFPNAEQILFETGRQVKVISVRNDIFSWNKIKSEETGADAFLTAIKKAGQILDLVDAVKDKAQELDVPLPPEVIRYREEMEKMQAEEAEKVEPKPAKTKSTKAAVADVEELEV